MESTPFDLLARVDVVLLVVSTIPFRILITNWCRVCDLRHDVLVSFGFIVVIISELKVFPKNKFFLSAPR